MRDLMHNGFDVLLQTSVCSLLREHFLLSSRSLRDKYQGRDDAANDKFTE